jgi:hypothetical protein
MIRQRAFLTIKFIELHIRFTMTMYIDVSISFHLPIIFSRRSKRDVLGSPYYPSAFPHNRPVFQSPETGHSHGVSTWHNYGWPGQNAASAAAVSVQ